MIPVNTEYVYRLSKQRSAMLDLLRSTASHPTALWLYERLKPDFPNLSLGTVYRNLSVLEKQGSVLVLRGSEGSSHFDADTSLHYHVLCERCGRIDDAGFSPSADLAAQAQDATGYRITAHRVDFYGVCPSCQKENG